jgi:heme-degrading monooxygenase HmoA
MYASLITGPLQPDKIDQAIGLYRDRIIPLARQQYQGFGGMYVLTDRASGQGLTIALYETEADARRVESSGQFREAVAAFGAVLAGQPTREVREVTYHDRRGQARYARVTEAALAPEQAARLGEDTAMPEAAARQPGYAGFLVTVDRARGRLTGMSLWESMAALEASEQGYYRPAMTAAAGQFGQPRRSVYEVAVQA